MLHDSPPTDRPQVHLQALEWRLTPSRHGARYLAGRNRMDSDPGTGRRYESTRKILSEILEPYEVKPSQPVYLGDIS
ncbi:hypothetical protein AUK22_05160 [bacterium CG2_30_54_10]|nr:MAG: hypothetical protein AUK22_05160 [bacterium CG2_30_54_10]